MCLVPATAAAQWVPVFSADFDGSIPAEVTGPGVLAPVQGWNGLGPTGYQFSGSMLHNAAFGSPQTPTVVTLTNLPPHSTLRIEALLAVVDSWDGVGGSPGPDSFNIQLDGAVVFSQIFGAASGTNGYVAPAGGWLSSGTQLGSLTASTTTGTRRSTSRWTLLC